MVIIDKETKNIMLDKIKSFNITNCPKCEGKKMILDITTYDFVKFNFLENNEIRIVGSNQGFPSEQIRCLLCGTIIE